MTQFYPSYQERKGIQLISWETFYGLCKGLGLAVAPFDPDIILGVARGGLYPATLLSNLMGKEFYPIRITRRLKDVPHYDTPIWRTRPPEAVNRMKVLIVDEICGSGRTLRMAQAETVRLGAREVRCASLFAHESGKDLPDYIGLITDELILNPWDRELLVNGQYVFHPEYVHALQLQGIAPDPSLLLGIETIAAAKSR
jgi:hypothetical protein